MTPDERVARFEAAILPYLDAAYNLARWLARDPSDAEEIVQESMVRAFTYFDGFHGGDGRAWLFAIVRNSFYTWARRRGRHATVPLEEEMPVDDGAPDPETQLLRRIDARELRAAIDELPVAFREALVLREIEGLSYREIADVAGIPIGTVMSRLARARGLVRRRLAVRGGKEA